jgi:hypothetical protein
MLVPITGKFKNDKIIDFLSPFCVPIGGIQQFVFHLRVKLEASRFLNLDFLRRKAKQNYFDDHPIMRTHTFSLAEKLQNESNSCFVCSLFVTVTGTGTRTGNHTSHDDDFYFIVRYIRNMHF